MPRSPLVPSFVIGGLAAAGGALFGCSSGPAQGGGTSSTASVTSSTSSSSTFPTGTTGSGGTGGATGTGGAIGTGGAGGATSSSSTTSSVDPATLDRDGDGWTPAQGDCCDVPGATCKNPELVNPGAFEYPGNGVDDDCDPGTSDSASTPLCSTAPLFSGLLPEDLLRAMDLCQFADASPASPQERKWGVINGSARLVLADGTTPLPVNDAVQVGVLGGYGPNVAPQRGATMAALSSGTARAPTDPGYVHPKNGAVAGQVGNYNGGTQATIQASYLAPHNGVPPSPASCGVACTSGCDQAYDSVDLRFQVRVPTNAQSFSYDFKFYSSEFPDYVCQKYNDAFVALLASTWKPDPNASPPQAPLPADGNIAFDALGNPVSVNNGFFQVCFPPFGAPAGACPSGTLDLIGNGMGGWGSDLRNGGGTDWLTNTAPVVPGEILELQLVLWDAGDHNLDSLVLLDHFRWSVTASAVGVHK